MNTLDIRPALEMLKAEFFTVVEAYHKAKCNYYNTVDAIGCNDQAWVVALEIAVKEECAVYEERFQSILETVGAQTLRDWQKEYTLQHRLVGC